MSSTLFPNQQNSLQAMMDSPQMKMIKDMISNKGLNAEQMVRDICKQRGINLDEFMSKLK